MKTEIIAKIGKGFLYLLKSPFIVFYWILKMAFTLKGRLYIAVIIIGFLLANSFISAYNEGDPSIILKDFIENVALSDGKLNDEVTNNPIVFNDMSEMNWWGKIKTFAVFIWEHFKLFTLVWLVFAWIQFFYFITKPTNTSKPARNFWIAIGIYFILVILGSYFYYGKMLFPFEGVVKFFGQLVKTIPVVSSGIVGG